MRENKVVSEKNVKNVNKDPLVQREEITFPPMYTKLGFKKQFAKALDKYGSCFAYIERKILQFYWKIKAETFDIPQLRQFIKDPAFVNLMNEVERMAWASFVAVVENFLGKRKDENYVELVTGNGDT